MRLFYSIFFLPFTLFAFYSGNPFSPTFLQKGFLISNNPIISVGAGYLGDFITEKKLLIQDRDGVNIGRVEDFSIDSQLSYISLILVHRMEINSYFGISKEKLQWTPINNSPVNTSLSSKNHFSYSLGTKIILLDLKALCLTLDVSYFSLPSSNKIKEKLEKLSFPYSLGDQTLRWNEWNVSIGTALRLGFLVPYFGGKYSSAKLKVSFSDSSDTVRCCNENKWGVFAGISIPLTNSMYVNAEWRHFDEEGYSLSAVFAF